MSDAIYCVICDHFAKLEDMAGRPVATGKRYAIKVWRWPSGWTYRWPAGWRCEECSR